MQRLDLHYKIHYTLRIAVAMCFIGHGSFGIITKPIWCNYFAVFGIGQHLSYQLMPLAGSFDILLGLVMLIYPVRAIPAWLVVWGILTALLRPLSGEPFAEFIERAGNFGAPLALLLLSGIPKNGKGWFDRVNPGVPATPGTPANVMTCLRILGYFLLLGHGWLNLIGKAALLKQYSALGFSDPVHLAQVIGIAEIAAAFMVLIKPIRPVVLIIFTWKMATELLYPQFTFFEWIERGGSYGVLLALWFITDRQLVVKFSLSHATRANEPD